MPEQNQTEKPTARRLQKARDKGDFPVSRHLLGGVQFLLAVTIISTFFAEWAMGLAQLMLAMFRRAATGELNGSELIYLARESLIRGTGGPAIAGLCLIAVVVLSQLLITRFGLSGSKLTPDFNKLNPVSKIKNMATGNLITFSQAVILIPLFLYLTFRISWQNLDLYLSLPHISATAAVVGIRIADRIAAVESGCCLPDPRIDRSGLGAPAFHPQSAHEQAGNQGRNQGNRGQPRNERPDQAINACTRAPSDDAGCQDGDSSDRQPYALCGRHPVRSGVAYCSASGRQGKEQPGAADSHRGYRIGGPDRRKSASWRAAYTIQCRSARRSRSSFIAP